MTSSDLNIDLSEKLTGIVSTWFLIRFSLRRPGTELDGGGASRPPPPADHGSFGAPARRGLTLLKLKQRIDMGNQNVIGFKGCSKCSDIIAVQDPRSARSHHNLLKLDLGSPGSSIIFSVRDPRSLGSHGNIAMTRSKIFRIPWENENIISKIPQNPGSCILEI